MRIHKLLLLIVCFSIGFSYDNVFSESNEKTVIIPNGSGIGPVEGCHLKNECYFPPGLIIEKGTTVTWKNEDISYHTVTSGNAKNGPNGVFDSKPIESGTEFSFTFETAETYPYFCLIHPWMEGLITVKSNTGDSEVLDKLDQGTNITIIGILVGIVTSFGIAYYFWQKKKSVPHK